MLIVKSKSWDDQLSKHFALKEFRCRCDHEDCLVTKVDTDLIDILEEIRAMLGTSLKVTSGFRCETHNKEVDGAVASSYHVKGMAADILVPDHYHNPLAAAYHGRLGIGFYTNRLHIDVRKGCARWGKIPK